MAERQEIPSKHFPALKASLPRMDGKVVAITGCTTGTGFVCAKTCAELGAQVVMLNRPSQRANDALAQIKSEVPNANVSLVACDLMRFESVREASLQLQDKFGEKGLDVLCNNAGIMATTDQATVDGCDTQMQTNHLSHFLLTAELFPLLEKAADKNGEARVVNHSSGARHFPYEPLEDKYFGKNGGKLGGDDGGCCCMPFTGGRWKRYQQTKLANVVFTYALDDRIKAKESKVKALVAHPGLSATNLQVTTSNDGGMGAAFTNRLMKGAAQSGEDGTCGIMTCCCAKDVASRQFYGPAGSTGPAVLVKEEGKLADQKARDMLWIESQKVTGVTFDL